MSDLSVIANLKGVKGAVLGDLAGGFHDAMGELDGEAVAAVMGFVASALGQAGEALGLGSLLRISVASEERGCLVLIRGSSVVTARVEPGRALAALEKVLDASQGRL